MMTKLPQVIINVRGVDKLRAGIDNEITAAVADASHELGKSGRVLLRPSGTEPVVRVMVEAPTDTQGPRGGRTTGGPRQETSRHLSGEHHTFRIAMVCTR